MSTSVSAEPVHRRPKLVEDSLRDKTPIYYFGLGSNMSRSHLENRSFDGEKIHVLSMEPAVVHNYRLAFNLPAFIPLEPAMGSLENIGLDEKEPERGSPTLPLYPYEKPECHGALIQLSADDYEKVMHSEGVSGNHFPVRNYEETVVTAVPYDNSKPPVKAVVLRVYPHVRLPRDVAPSARYMKILRDGAAELGLAKCYQDFLQNHPVQTTPIWLQIVALPNLLLTMNFYLASSSLPWVKRLTRLQYNVMYQVYACPTSPAPKRWLSHILQGLFLLPGSCLGLGLLGYRFLTNTRHPVPVEIFLAKMKHQMKNQLKQSDGVGTNQKALKSPGGGGGKVTKETTIA